MDRTTMEPEQMYQRDNRSKFRWRLAAALFTYTLCYLAGAVTVLLAFAMAVIEID